MTFGSLFHKEDVKPLGVAITVSFSVIPSIPRRPLTPLTPLVCFLLGQKSAKRSALTVNVNLRLDNPR